MSYSERVYERAKNVRMCVYLWAEKRNEDKTRYEREKEKRGRFLKKRKKKKGT